MTKNLRNDCAAETRMTPEYAQAMQLLTQKKELQAQLREVDRMLRELEHVAQGVISLARRDIDFKSEGKLST